MEHLEVYKSVYCCDCKKTFYVSGSAPAVNIKCFYCSSTNWDISPFKQMLTKSEVKKKQKK